MLRVPVVILNESPKLAARCGAHVRGLGHLVEGPERGPPRCLFRHQQYAPQSSKYPHPGSTHRCLHLIVSSSLEQLGHVAGLAATKSTVIGVGLLVVARDAERLEVAFVISSPPCFGHHVVNHHGYLSPVTREALHTKRIFCEVVGSGPLPAAAVSASCCRPPLCVKRLPALSKPLGTAITVRGLATRAPTRRGARHQANQCHPPGSP